MNKKLLHKVLNLLIILAVSINFVLVSETGRFRNSLLEIYFLDIGQGDSILIKTPDNRYGLIDSGKGMKVLSELAEVMPRFNKVIDFVIATHPDADHIEGFMGVLKNYQIKNFFIGRTDKHNELYEEVKNLIFEKHIKNYSLESANDFSIDGLDFDLVWPDSTNSNKDLSITNETSISFIMKFHNFSVYSAGDLGKENELKSIHSSLETVDVLKVSHHGSNSSTSKEFLAKLLPKLSVISVGKGNSYGHPTPQVVENIESINSQILRTDESGRITIKTNGYKLWYSLENTGQNFYIDKI